MKGAYYNEHDRFAAAWLRELIKAGEIPDGDVDERDIEDVVPAELAGYRQCHFFAGIGGWAYALRLAGWPDDRPVWTGSCPCQPFSTAGKGAGFADERHLWPAWHWLIAQCRPDRIYGEQVASGPGLMWLDLVSTDLEALLYAVTAIDLPSASVGATDIRQRLWWMADADAELVQRGGIVGPRWRFEPAVGRAICDCGHRSEQHRFGIDECLECSCTFWLADSDGERRAGLGLRVQPGRPQSARAETWGRSETGWMGDASGEGSQERSGHGRIQRQALDASAREAAERGGDTRRLADPVPAGRTEWRPESWSGSAAWRGEPRGLGDADERREGAFGSLPQGAESHRAGGSWRDAEWIPCRDGKWRPVEPGTFPLAHGLPRSMDKSSAALRRLASVAGLSRSSLKRAKSSRIGQLRGYGNAINPYVAAAFIRATEEGLKSYSRSAA